MPEQRNVDHRNFFQPMISHSTLLKSCDCYKEGLDGRNVLVSYYACGTEETSVFKWSRINTIYIY